jgi:DNA-binding protein HU-beta
MTKAELISIIAGKAGLTKADAEKALNAFLSAVEEILINEGRLTLIGFGTFLVGKRKERKGRNPQTGEEIRIPACNVVKFKPGKLLKEAVK